MIYMLAAVPFALLAILLSAFSWRAFIVGLDMVLERDFLGSFFAFTCFLGCLANGAALALVAAWLAGKGSV
jgi:hypothetical protein